MTVCLNPTCTRSKNPDQAFYCQNCGSKLLLANRYRPIRLIGQGGFGKTFLAVDVAPGVDALNVEVVEPATYCVIKQLLSRFPGQDDRQIRKLFQQEVAQLALLGQHPQIPKLLTHFETDAAQYLVQEWIEGQNLETVLAQQGNFNEAQIRQLLADLLPVLRFVHGHQIVHRDIKPANIIRPAVGARYVLVDFGASKQLTESVMAKTGTTIGSAGYAAPEQAMGKADFASDLYSLGVTCVHLLTGLHPFDLYSISEDRWIWRQYLTQPVSVELRRVLDKLLHRATSQRYQSASEVLQDLRLEAKSPQPLLQKIPVAAGTHSPPLPHSPTSSPSQWHCVRTLTGHQGKITALALSPDGELIASGSTDKTIKLWSLDGELLYTWPGKSFRFLQGHQDRITALRFSPSSEILVSSSADGTIKQWDLNSGNLFSSLPGHGWGVTAIALSPEEPLLTSGSDDGLIQLWDLETEALITNLVQLTEPITALVIDSAGDTVWSSSGKSICQWDLATDRMLTALKGHAEGVTAIALRSDNCTLISGGNDKLLKIWNLNTGQQQKVIAAHRERIHAIAIHPDDPIFASASEDTTIKLWDLWTGERLATLRHAWGVNTIGFSVDGELLISGSADETIKIWQRR
jgi:WD40 repeat protein